jgi:hypothetical protein
MKAYEQIASTLSVGCILSYRSKDVLFQAAEGGNHKPAMKIDPNHLEARHKEDVALDKLHKKIKWYTSNGQPVYE